MDEMNEELRAERARRADLRRREKARGVSAWEPWQKWTLGAAVAVVTLLVLAVAVDAAASAGRIHPGVTVAGVRVGGMTPAAAASALELQLPGKTSAPVTVTYEDKTWDVKPADIGVTFDYPALAASAMKIGRTGGFSEVVSQRASAWVRSVDVTANAIPDQAKLKKQLDKIASSIDVPARNASLDVRGVAITVKASAPGVELDREQLTASMMSAFASSQRTVVVPVAKAAPRIDDDAAAHAKSVVEKMVASPLTVTFGTAQWTFQPGEIGDMIAFRAVEATGAAAGKAVLEPFVSAEEASVTVAPKLGAGVGKPAVNARFKTNSGSVVIVPSQDGIGPDLETLAADITTVLKDESSPGRTVELHTVVTKPQISTEQAQAMGVSQRIGTFTTTYGADNLPRVNNIHTLGNALDGKLVGPGQTFSFNGAVGERTAAKGYQEANAIVKGKLVPQLGGGICQVGTTMFNAVFFSGLPVLERHNHSFYISHYPTGRDATVSWGGPDLKWKNDTKNWVLVSVSYTSSSITISLYGTSPGYDVAYTTGPFTDIKPFPTENQNDPTLAVGVRVVQDKGETGKKCVVTRTVTSGGQVVRTDTFTSNYKPKIEVVRVGTKPKASTGPTATVTPKP